VVHFASSADFCQLIQRLLSPCRRVPLPPPTVAALVDALAKLGITRLEAEITIAADKPTIAGITAFAPGQDVRDLASRL
jgi:hypothetical protein